MSGGKLKDAAGAAMLRAYPEACCVRCGKPAVCFGEYESDSGEYAGFSCGVCCGHGNEDGWCVSRQREEDKLADVKAWMLDMEVRDVLSSELIPELTNKAAEMNLSHSELDALIQQATKEQIAEDTKALAEHLATPRP